MLFIPFITNRATKQLLGLLYPMGKVRRYQICNSMPVIYRKRHILRILLSQNFIKLVLILVPTQVGYKVVGHRLFVAGQLFTFKSLLEVGDRCLY
ncbi:MAG: hypothetical protein JGK31_04550 [Microcoleus sp. PH2017_30_WIL_O_A]|nr:hypothetical protein [Microcoleus sp. PH2017_30_WIL_O_A]